MITTNTNVQKTFKGTVLKMVVNFSYPADNTVTLDSLTNWQTEWYCNNKVYTIKKAAHERETVLGGVVFYAYVDTSVTGAGTLKMRLKAEIPDDFLESGYRTEYAEITTDVIIY